MLAACAFCAHTQWADINVDAQARQRGQLCGQGQRALQAAICNVVAAHVHAYALQAPAPGPEAAKPIFTCRAHYST